MNAARLMMTNHFRLSMVAVAAVLAACLLALVVRVEPSQAAFPGQNGKIAFLSNRDGTLEIYVMNPDGSDQTSLTNNLTGAGRPAWSPDGTKIAFNGGPDPGIYTMNADGSNQTRITSNDVLFSDTEPVWSPDGTKIAFISRRDNVAFEIYTMNADGSNQTRLTNNLVDEFDPAWSPDGTKIAFTRQSATSRDYEIYTMNADGSNQTNISNNFPGRDREPDWSPDGTKIAFWSNRDSNALGPREIYTMNPDGSNQINLTNNPTADDTEPAWSPDGSKIAFSSAPSSAPGADFEIYTMNADGSNQTNISNNTALPGRLDIEPDWQPLPNNTAPTITNLSPAPDSTTTDLTPTISATVTDQQTNLTQRDITLKLDGALVPPKKYSYNRNTDTLSYTPAKKLSYAAHSVEVVATDDGGLSTPKSWSFKIVHP